MTQTEISSCRACRGIQKAVLPSYDSSHMTRRRAFGPRNRCGATGIFLIVFLLSGIAYADDLVDARACKYLVTYQPSPVNGADYTPGTDVHGKPVVEADISPSPVTIPDNFSFDVDVDVARAVGLPVPSGSQSLTKIGTVTYDKGQLLYNGQPMEGPAEAALIALCKPQKH